MTLIRSILGLAIVFTTITSTTPAQYVCQPGQAPIVIQGSINAGDLIQTGRITRDGIPSTCLGSGAAIENSSVIRRDAHNLVNPFSETVCVKVEVDFSGCANQTMSAAYSNYNPLLPAQNIIGDMGFSTIATGSYLFSVGPNASYTLTTHELDPNTGCGAYTLKVTYLRGCRQPGFDKTNDGKADITVYRTASNSQWWTLDSSNNQASVRNFGTVGDLVTGGSDYTGDGRTDLSGYRTSTNTWYYATDPDFPSLFFTSTNWGTAGDRQVPGDYDGDGKNDIAVWRPSDGTFYVLRSSNGSFLARQWGANGDRNVTGDFDGDNVSDFAVVRPTGGGLIWYVLKSNYNYGFNQILQWGLPAGDVLVPGDYDGDSITDIAVWREAQGTFYVRQSSNGGLLALQWGTSGDKAQPADFDGDKKTDFAVYRPSSGFWYIRNSSTQTFRAEQFGLPSDIPISAPYRVQ